MSEPEFLTVADVIARLPFKVAKRELRRKLRLSGLCIGNGWALALPAEHWPDFLEQLKCKAPAAQRRASPPSKGRTVATVGSRAGRGRNLTRTETGLSDAAGEAVATLRALCAKPNVNG